MSEKTDAKAWFEDKQGQRYAVPDAGAAPVVVGRGASYASAGKPCVDIPQDNLTMTVSRQHARLEWTAETEWRISDVGSRFGLFVDGQKVEGGSKRALKDGASIKLGAYELTFRVAAVPAEVSQEKTLVEAQEPGAEAAAPCAAPSASAPPPKEEKWEEKPRPVEAAPAPCAAPSASAPPFAAAPSVPTGATQPIPDFQPGSLPGAAFFGGTRFYLDARLGGKLTEIEILQTPGQTQWTVGREKTMVFYKGQASTEHITVPNLPECRTVSRKHVQLTRLAEGGWRAKNLSRQGAWVHDRYLTGEEEADLKPGGRLILGSVVLFFRQGEKKREYDPKEFDATAIVRETKAAAAASVEADITRELPPDFQHRIADQSAAQAWGYLIENTHANPRQFALTKRTMRIGSHPLNSDIQMEDPGIGDLYAIVKWHGKDVKIHSRSRDMPVRVDHVPYLTSSPLKSGAIVTLGNQEFNLKIVGEPPELLSWQMRQRLRRATIFFVLALNVLFFGGFFGLRAIAPDKGEVKIKPRLAWADIVADVVQKQGLTGLSALEESFDSGQGRLREQKEIAEKAPASAERDKTLKAIKDEEDEIAQIRSTVIAQLNTLAGAYRSIRHTAPEEFGKQTDAIQQVLNGGKQVFRSAYLNENLAEQGWYKEIVDAFEDRKDTAFSSQWTQFLTSLRDNNMTEAKTELTQLAASGFRQERLDEANEVIRQWTRIEEEARGLNADEILTDHVRQCESGKGLDYLNEKKSQVGKLQTRLDEMQDSRGAPAKALCESARWKSLYEAVTGVKDLVGLMDAYEAGDVAGFSKLFPAVSQRVNNNILPAMNKNLQAWQAWNDRYSASSNALLDYSLVRDLTELSLQIKESIDPESKLSKSIRGRLDSLVKSRIAHADKLRREAGQLASVHEKLMKLLEAYEYDPSEKAGAELESVAIQHLGDLNMAGAQSVAAEKQNLRELLARYNEMIAKGILPDAYNPKRQLQTLMSQFHLDGEK